MQDGRSPSRLRIAALAVAALVLSAAAIQPAVAHVTTRLGHLLKHLDPVYVNIGEKASNADQLDGQDSSAFLGKSQKAADADLLDGQNSTAFLGAGAKAADADLLDGQNSSAFLGVGAKAADAEQLDGIDSTGFARGYGEVLRGAVAIDPQGPFPHQFLFGRFNEPNAPSPNVSLGYQCPSNLADNGQVTFFNHGNETLNVFTDNGGANPSQYLQVGPHGNFAEPASATGEHITIQAQGAGTVHIEVFSVHRASDCHAQSLGWFAF